MKKMTLLEIVQNIASALETDEIESITDTTESLQIAEIVKETFYEQFNNIMIPEFRRLFKLEALTIFDHPNYLKVPADVSKIYWIKYRDLRTGRMNNIPYITPEEFLETQFQFSGSSDYVLETMDPATLINYYIMTNSPPTAYTMFDDTHLAFNAIDYDYQTVLTANDSVGYGLKSFDFVMADDFVPPIDASLFPLLLAESKAVAFINLKQVASAKEEERARRQRVRMQNDQFKARQAQHRHFNDRNNYARNR